MDDTLLLADPDEAEPGDVLVDDELDDELDDRDDRPVVLVPVAVDALLAELEVSLVVDDVLGSVEAELLEVCVLAPVVGA